VEYSDPKITELNDHDAVSPQKHFFCLELEILEIFSFIPKFIRAAMVEQRRSVQSN